MPLMRENRRRQITLNVTPYIYDVDAVALSLINQFKADGAAPEVTRLEEYKLLLTFRESEELTYEVACQKVLWNQYVQNIEQKNITNSIELLRKMIDPYFGSPVVANVNEVRGNGKGQLDGISPSSFNHGEVMFENGEPMAHPSYDIADVFQRPADGPPLLSRDLNKDLEPSTITAHKKKYSGVFDNVEEPDYGSPEELAEAKSVGISRTMYNHLRSPNPPRHPSESSYEPIKMFIPTHKHIMEMGNLGIDPFDYDAANIYGINHSKILDIHKRGINVGDFVEARRHGLTEEQINGSKDLKGDIQQRYKDLVDAHKHQINLDDYTEARRNGATHQEALDVVDAHNNGIDLYNYGYARRNGVTHQEILDAHNNGIDLYNYGYARSGGATHQEALDAGLRITK